MTLPSNYDECSATAALYALGALPSDEARHFELRLAGGCPLCTAEYSNWAEVADHLAASVAFQEPPPSLRERVLARLQPSGTGRLKHPAEMTLVRSSDSSWRALAIPGVQIRPLLGEKTLLVRMEPGTVFPEHHHREAEQCYVLEGSITDSSGITAYAGDFVSMAAGSKHEPIHTDTGCLFLIAYTA